MNRHKAGQVLTDDLSEALQRGEDLHRLDQGKFVEEGNGHSQIDKKASLRALYRKWHPHPVFVHFPIGSLSVGGLLQLLFLISKKGSFENAAFYSILFATIFEIPAVASGIFSWWLNYRRALTPVFKKKLICSVALLIMSCCIAITRLLITDISFRLDILSYVYNVLVFSSVLAVFAAAYYGGKISWH